jgi:nucleoside-diphosphate-sugar epimerase
MRILVTGYGGFLGSAICRQLLQAGHSVSGLARHHYPEMEAIGVQAIVADLRDRHAVIDACRGMDAVIHTAAKAGVWGDWQEYYHINTLATECVIDGCRKHQVGVLVYSSSPSVTFDGHHQSGIDESVPYPTKWLCHYPHSKALAEQKVLAANDATQGLRTVALRPHLIWGKDDPHLIPRLIDRCKAGRLACIGRGINQIDTVHVEAAAEAHLLALEVLIKQPEKAGGKAYFITDDEPIECWKWITMILEQAGLKAPRKRIPLVVAYFMGACLEAGFRGLGRKDEPPMTRFVAKQLGLDHYFSIAAARRDLGYQPRVNRQNLLETMDSWLKQLAKSRSPK